MLSRRFRCVLRLKSFSLILVSKPLSNVPHVKYLGCLAPCKDLVVRYCEKNGYNNKNNKIIIHSIFIQKYKFCFGMQSGPRDCTMLMGLK